MKKLYKKSQLAFALVWIGIYCAAQSAASALSNLVGIGSAFEALFNVALSALLLVFLGKNGLFFPYGLCKSSLPAGKLLWYVPLLLLISSNLWHGVRMNLPPLDTVCYLVCMLCVGFLEELIFRGFLFKAMAQDNVKSAILISSITFGIGHLLNLVNGNGMTLVANLCQVGGAMAIGFAFVVLFHRSGTLVPCIVTHSAINMLSAFADETGMTPLTQILHSGCIILIAAAYALVLAKLPPKTE